MSTFRHPIEGDLIEIYDGSVFAVKGFLHPPDKIVAYPKYIATGNGLLSIKALTDAIKILRERYADLLVYDRVFDSEICEVPYKNIKRIYYPEIGLQEIKKKRCEKLINRALELIDLIRDTAGVSEESLGISGSILIGKARETSDIDLIVYGERECLSVYRLLKDLREEGLTHPLTETEMHSLYCYRAKDTRINFDEFRKLESKKLLQGRFKDVQYFIRLLRGKQRQVYDFIRFEDMGEMSLTALVVDDKYSIFTPCSYTVETFATNARIEFVVSHRGRFCEIAKKGCKIFVHGKVEKVVLRPEKKAYLRLLVDYPGHFIRTIEAEKT